MSVTSILIASDMSERSDRALRRGLSLAAALGARATVAAVVDDSLPDDIAEDLARKCRNHLEASIAGLGGAACDVLVEIGAPADRLVRLANDERFDLVVAGRHRGRGVLDDFRRTTVERLVAQTPKSVLLAVRAEGGPYRSVLALTAFSPACRRAVETAREIAPDAALRLAHVWAAPFEGLTGGEKTDYATAVERETADMARNWAKDVAGGAIEVELLHGAVGSTLHAEMRRTAPELLAIGAHTRSLSLSGLGSMAAELLRDPPTDLLIATGAAGGR